MQELLDRAQTVISRSRPDTCWSGSEPCSTASRSGTSTLIFAVTSAATV